MRRILPAVACLIVLAYLLDDASVRFKVPARETLASVQVQPYYAIRQKSGKIEYDFNVPPETQQCVQSLFPHLGYSPCWYVKKHASKRIDI